MEIKKEILEDLIEHIYYQEASSRLEEIKKEKLEKLIEFAKSEQNDRKIRKFIRENIKLVLKELMEDEEEEEEEEEDDIFGQSMKSSASGDDIKVMTAYGDASHPDHDEAVKMVQKAKAKDPDLDVPKPGHAGSGSSGETSNKSPGEEEPETGTVFQTDKPSYKGIDGDDTQDPKDRAGYIYGDDEVKLPTFARDLPLYWKLKAHAGEEDEVMTQSPISTFVYKQKKRKRGSRVSPGGFR